MFYFFCCLLHQMVDPRLKRKQKGRDDKFLKKRNKERKPQIIHKYITYICFRWFFCFFVLFLWVFI